ncbi:spore coat protein U domain-containing protein [Vibrio marisflavi]|uniref:Spore coat protein U/FanG domain-containing protein n=1 Tax=Vibrio marisflavi CECT 7928 TaxID=634439 RepID=A0ABM9A112_9VIBR|nr:spore coat protein U domain-containing protein [Vibrio marisflavi]CAH0537227.1 hypothetical protein VMF7928_01003 [Vibrio marisflavi CECT 7928]
MKKISLLALMIAGVLPFAANADVDQPTQIGNTLDVTFYAAIKPECTLSGSSVANFSPTGDGSDPSAVQQATETLTLTNCYVPGSAPDIYTKSDTHSLTNDNDGNDQVAFNLYTDSDYKTAITSEGSTNPVPLPVTLDDHTGTATVYAQTAKFTGENAATYKGTVTFEVYY